MLPTKFLVNWHFSSDEEAINRFSRWPPFLIGIIGAIFDLQVTLMIPTKFQINWSIGKKINFQDGFHGGHLGFPIGTILAIFDLRHPNASFQVSSQLAFVFRKRSEKKHFQDGHHGGHLGYPIGRILAIFDLQVTPMLPTMFRVN